MRLVVGIYRERESVCHLVAVCVWYTSVRVCIIICI